MPTALTRRTAVVSGPLAFKMRRTAAARAGDHGLEVLTLPLLAARLAGGFIQPAPTDALQGAVKAALAEGGFAEIEAVRQLPGTPRAMLRTLTAAWRADVRLQDRAGDQPRLADLALVETRVRKTLPSAAFIPPDLRDAALTRLDHAAALLGAVTLDGLTDVEPVWRPLVAALCAHTPVRWRAPPGRDHAWFPGVLEATPLRSPPVIPSAEVCADPRAEVVEALRWARSILSGGDVAAADIGLAAVSPQAWDEHLAVLARDTGLALHFTHGLPALETREGQACAALADLLLNGLSQPRVRRLLRRAPGAAPDLPDDWPRGLSRAAGLFTPDQWRHALEAARSERPSGPAAEQVLVPIVGLLALGAAAAGEAGERLLQGPALALWRAALAAAPPEALALSLQTLRVPDTTSPASAISWGPAAHLAAAPRPHMRLLGFSSRTWPRGRSEDPLLPDHVLDRAVIELVGRSEEDAWLFEMLGGAATGSLALSRSRRSAQGAPLPPSHLWPPVAATLARTRIPDHAFSESDRLLARPQEAAREPRLALGRLCWTHWSQPGLTAHDGAFAPDDPVVRRALGQTQSATSLRRLLRDPLGFVWRHVLGWRGVETTTLQLSLDPRTFGELVHELLRLAVAALEPDPGFARASASAVEAAVAAAAQGVLADWPLTRAVPPPLLWRRSVDEAARLACEALVLDDTQPGTRSWTEAAFGDAAVSATAGEGPWDSVSPILFGDLRVRGRIDRLDLRPAGDAARVTDYKTGAAPRRLDTLVLGQGGEVQRVLYAAAARQLLPDLRQTVSRLVYLRDGPAGASLTSEPLDAAIAEAEGFVRIATGLLRAGAAAPGPDALESYNDLRLALPAALDLYLRRKGAAFEASAGPLTPLWSRP